MSTTTGSSPFPLWIKSHPLTAAGFLNTTQTLTHASPLPAGTTRDLALAMIRDDEHFLNCNPHKSKHEPVPTPSDPPPAPPPDSTRALGETRCYKVTDVVHTLPAGLWDSEVVSTYEFVDVADGVFVRIRSPMGVVLETVWSISGGGDGAKTPTPEMREQVTIKCSRLLVGPVKGACQSNWKSIHENLIAGIKS